MVALDAARLGKSLLTGLLVVGFLGLAFGEPVMKRVNYWKFITIELHGAMAFWSPSHLIAEKQFKDEMGATRRLFVISETSEDGLSSQRVVMTDEEYRILSTYCVDSTAELKNAGLLAGVSPPVLELFSHDPKTNATVCQHMRLFGNSVVPYEYAKKRRRG